MVCARAAERGQDGDASDAVVGGDESAEYLRQSRSIVDHPRVLTAPANPYRIGARYTLPPELAIASDHPAALEHGRRGLIVIATPMSGLREQLASAEQLASVGQTAANVALYPLRPVSTRIRFPRSFL